MTGTHNNSCDCFHCGLPVPASAAYSAEIAGQTQPMCCPGCAAIADAIVSAGHGDYYRHRTSKSAAPPEQLDELTVQLDAYDHPRVRDELTSDAGDALKSVSLILQGLTCAACVWLVERHLGRLEGVRQAEANFATRRARVVFDPERTGLSRILRAIHEIGYVAHPYDPHKHEALAEGERKAQLQRLGVAGALGMQVMMIATALYFGEWRGMSSDHRVFFHWISVLLTVPIIFYCARPFYQGAWRDIKRIQPGMDVPVALGLSIAFAGSLWSTLTQTGAVYFESVAMFVLLLLAARYFEHTARARGIATVEALDRAFPDTAQRIGMDGARHLVLAEELQVGDRVVVPAGAAVPADGVVLGGESLLDESLLTGESRAIRKSPGDDLVAGTVNTANPLTVEIRRVRADTLVARIGSLIERAQNNKGPMVEIANRTAVWFVGMVLLLAALTAWVWWQRDPDQLIPVLISVLVVTCPCALSLATPTAMAIAVTSLSRHGLVPVRADALARLPRVNHVVFDKTGTLTEGRPRLVGVTGLAEVSTRRAVELATALEADSAHPLARALQLECQTELSCEDTRHSAGGGISGTIAGQRYFIGNLNYLAGQGIPHPEHGAKVEGGHTVTYLADPQRVLAQLCFADSARPSAASVVEALADAGIEVSIYSGDHEGAVAKLARELKVADYRAQLTPEEKMQGVEDLRSRGRSVLMIGDGINDAPVLAASDLSIAMGAGSDLARTSADMVLLSNQLQTVPWALALAQRTRRVIWQNIAWAVGYNLLALPAAMVGLVPPWAAAIGMSASSLIVVANATRLGRGSGQPPTTTRDTSVAYA